MRVHQDMPWGLFRQAVARTFDCRQYEVHLVAVGGRLCRVAPLCVGEREKVEHLRRERIGFQRLRTGLDDGQQVGVGGCVDVQPCERFVETVECGVRLQRAVLRLVGVAVVKVVVVVGREGRVGLLVAQPEVRIVLSRGRIFDAGLDVALHGNLRSRQQRQQQPQDEKSFHNASISSENAVSA